MSFKTNRPGFKEAFLFWLKLGFISFGGPAGQIAIMHEYVVEKKKWISEQKFMHALNYCMLLPGPEAQQLATYIGWLLHNIRGGLAAGLLFVLPSTIIMLILSVTYVTFGKIPVVYSVFGGLKPAVTAIVLVALIKIAGKSLKNIFSYLFASLSFVFIFFFHIPFPYIIIFTIIASVLLKDKSSGYFNAKISAEAEREEEKKYFINKYTVSDHSDRSLKNASVKIIIFLILWAVPLLFFRAFSDNSIFMSELILFFTKSAFITFGGAYSVLTYIAQVAVENYHWLSKLQMIDGLALGETTPGPLIMILSFVGFMAGYNNSDYSLMSGILCLITTTYYTFLPSFFFIFTGAPFIEMTQHNEKIRNILNYVSASVAGVILNLTVYIALAVIFPGGINSEDINYFGIVWMIISFAALYFYKINIVKWIAVSGAAGIIHYSIFSL